AAKVSASFDRAMDDDLNTPAALAALQNFRSDVNSRLPGRLSAAAAREVVAVFRKFGEVLGLFQVPVEKWEFNKKDVTVSLTGVEAKGHLGQVSVQTVAEIERWIAERNEARSKKDFAKADVIRKELALQGIILEDRQDGTTRWKR